MAVHEGRVALACRRLNRLGTDGTTGGLPLEGPETSFGNGRKRGVTGSGELLPRSAALSPDGKTLYLTGFNRAGWRPNWRLVWVQGVAKIDLEKGRKMETFAGVLSSDPKQGGSANGRFKSPVSVDTDPQGRVYVADRFNDRVQIFDAGGKHLKNIKIPDGPTSLPSEVAVDRRTGDIYVFSWYVGCYAFRKFAFRKRRARLFHYGPFDKPELKGTYELPIPDQSRRGRYGGDQLQGREFRATIDSWAPGDSGPYVWLVPGAASGRRGSVAAASPRVLRMDRKKKILEEVAGFNSRARRLLPANDYWGNGNRWLAVRPTTGEVYVQRGNTAVAVDPGTGKARVVKLPMSPMSGGLYFDIEGHAYLRATRYVARFAISPGDRWREIPFDYGEKRAGRISVVPVETPSIHGQPAFSVSVDQHLVVGYIIGKVQTHDRTRDGQRQAAFRQWKRWVPSLFPGRGGNTIVTVWDKYGRVVHKDAVRGVGYLAGAFVDRRGGLYLATEAQRRGYFDKLTGTFVKFRNKGKIFSTEATLPLEDRPPSAPDTHRGAGHKGSSWWEGAEWFYGGMGYCGKNNSTCHCPKFQAAHDYFARSFVPETQHYSVAVLDAAGNLVLRIGDYGNVDDGVPLIRGEKVKLWKPRPMGSSTGSGQASDEVGLFYPAYLATHTDRRLFVNDPGNQRVVSVKLGYRTEHRTALKNVKDAARR
jgi:sugar lactone lactonase YvrE